MDPSLRIARENKRKGMHTRMHLRKSVPCMCAYVCVYVCVRFVNENTYVRMYAYMHEVI